MPSRSAYAGIAIGIIAVASLAVYFGFRPTLDSQPEEPVITSSSLQDQPTDVGDNPLFLDIISSNIRPVGTDVQCRANPNCNAIVLTFTTVATAEIPELPNEYIAFSWSTGGELGSPTIFLIFDPSVGDWIASIENKPPGEPTTEPSYSIQGNKVTVSVTAEALGDPQNLVWYVTTGSRSLGENVMIDRVPDSGNAIWPVPSFGQ